ncbi:hypothetical protein BRPE64_BCDS06200 [Caballeronia insecticola]|uniref:Uncharacterized protein n=1 Tax=Caballeronia insecticola TaxID=758793 RepID=R4X058_9BURK|nr:hypothetical protein BRPE64_BCDS06200 [Caballeronia insecticola]
MLFQGVKAILYLGVIVFVKDDANAYLINAHSVYLLVRLSFLEALPRSPGETLR